MNMTVRVNCDVPMCAQETVIHDPRWQGSRRTISLLVTNPRITEWLHAGDCKMALSRCYQTITNVTSQGEKLEIVFPLDNGHFITGTESWAHFS